MNHLHNSITVMLFIDLTRVKQWSDVYHLLQNNSATEPGEPLLVITNTRSINYDKCISPICVEAM